MRKKSFRSSSKVSDISEKISESEEGSGKQFRRMDTLEFHIDAICEKIKSPESNEFTMAVAAFQRFVQTQYNKEKMSNNESMFLNSLFQSISLTTHTPYEYVTLVHAIISLDLGDKMGIANRITPHLTKLPPDPNPLIWDNIDDILRWLSHCLKDSMQLVLFMLRQSALNWPKEDNSNTNVAGYRGLKVLVTCFADSMVTDYTHIQGLILLGLNRDSKEVLESVLDLMRVIISDPRMKSYFNMEQLYKRLLLGFQPDRYNLFNNFVSAIELICETNPGLSKYFDISLSPLAMLKNKASDTAVKMAALRVIPMIVKLSPTRYPLADIFKAMRDLMKKRGELLVPKKKSIWNITMLTLAQIMFNRKMVFDKDELDRLNKFRKMLTKKDYNDLPALHYLNIAFLALRKSEAKEQEIISVFCCPLSEPVIDGIWEYVDLCPDQKPLVYDLLIKRIQKVLFDNNSTPEQIVFVFKTLIRLNMPSSFIPFALALRFSIYANSPDIATRKSAMDFLLGYHEDLPSIEIHVRILSIIATELNEKLRVDWMRRLRKHPLDSSLLVVLRPLLHDSSHAIQHDAIRYLTMMPDVNGVCELMEELLHEKVAEMEHSSSISKDSIKCFQMISDVAFDRYSPVPAFQNLLSQFADFLVNLIIDSGSVFLPVMTLSLLSDLLKIARAKSFDLFKLVQHIDSALLPHSSARRLESALKLLISALDHTELRFEIYTKYPRLIVKLHQIAKLAKRQVDRPLLLRAVTSIGAVKPSMVQSLVDQIMNPDELKIINTPMSILALAETNDQKEALLYTATGIAICTLLDMMSDETLLTLFVPAMDALQIILRRHRQIGTALEGEILRKMDEFMSNENDATLTNLVASFPTLIGILNEQFGPYVPRVVDFICAKWNTLNQIQLLRITEWMQICCAHDLEPHVLRLANLFVSGLLRCSAETADSIFSSFIFLGSYISSTGHVIYPAMLEWINANALDTESCSQALKKLKQMILKGASEPFSAQIIRTMIKIVTVNKSLYGIALDVVYTVAVLTDVQFLMYLPSVQKVFDFGQKEEMRILVEFYQRGEAPPEELKKALMAKSDMTGKRSSTQIKGQLPEASSYQIDIPHHEWEEAQWGIWWEKLNAELLLRSESRSISVCKEIAIRHALIKNTLFPVAYALMYVYSEKRGELDGIVSVVFRAPHCPGYIIRGFLSAMEIFEVLQIQCQMDMKLVAKRAMDVNAYEHSLRLYEAVLAVFDDEHTVECLVSLNQQLGQPQAANGVLNFCKASKSQAVLAEKLGLWEDAFKVYSNDNPKNMEGIMNCLRALSRFSELKQQAKDGYYLASAHWHLFEYQEFLNVAQKLDIAEERNRYFLILSLVMQYKFAEAQRMIDEMRESLTDKIFPIVGEDYERAYRDFSEVCFLSEIEEVMRYKRDEIIARDSFAYQRDSAIEDMKQIHRLWNLRFEQLMPFPEVLHGHLCIRSMVLPISAQRESFLALLSSAITNHRLELAESIIDLCLARDPCDEYRVARAKLLWEKENKEQAISELVKYATNSDNRLLLSQWLHATGREKEARQQLTDVLKLEMKNSWPWDTWSQINLALAKTEPQRTPFLVDSLNGVVNALLVTKRHALTYTLRILRILFEHGETAVFQEFLKRVEDVPVHIWIDVLPQIMSRLASSVAELQSLIRVLIIKVGQAHPHSVLFPLMVLKALDDPDRQKNANEIIQQLRNQNPVTVDSVTKLGSELERISITLWEVVIAGIDEASRAYVNRNNIEEMMSLLGKVNKHNQMTPVSFFEISFVRSYGESMKLAEEWWEQYSRTKDPVSLEIMWHYYTSVFYSMRPLIKDMKSIELEDASPHLASLKDTPIPVPGTYVAGQEVIGIKSICHDLTIIDSKQRPRKMAMLGSDGVKYTFLLKPHEDTRLDERVMQLFSFINVFVEDSMIPLRQKLPITTYKVIPITGEVGLIGWVPDCCTLFDVIRNYREKKSIQLECEFQAVMSAHPDYENLPLEQKRRAFAEGYRVSRGDDIKVVLFNNSANSADWLNRRTNYTASLAMTSMAGYILGLGDRHMCNLMIKTRTAKLVHIDFGDCFEVAQHRKRYPEKVPFRLTRMITSALEVAGYNGTFKSLCKDIMTLLRKHYDQIIGLISVFSYDPLRQWYVGTDSERGGHSIQSGEATAIISRIADKLNGNDFEDAKNLSVDKQVERLIGEATSSANLCGMFKGWYPWW